MKFTMPGQEQVTF